MSLFNIGSKSKNILKDEDNEFFSLIKAYDDGESWAQQKMDQLWCEGDSDLVSEIDQARIAIYKDAAYKGDKKAMYWLGFSLRGRDNAESLRLLTELAEDGDIDAMTAIARGYRIGGYEKDEDEYMKWMLMAAEAGDAEAQTAVGLQYKIQNQIDEAIMWYQKAALQEFSEGYYGLAESYLLKKILMGVDDRGIYEQLGNLAEHCYIGAIKTANTDTEAAQASFGIAGYYRGESAQSKNERERQDLLKRAIFFYYEAYLDGNVYGWKNMQEIIEENGIDVDTDNINEWAVTEGIISG